MLMNAELMILYEWILNHQTIFFSRVVPLLLAVAAGGAAFGMFWGYRLGVRQVPARLLSEHWLNLRIRSLEEPWCPVCGVGANPEPEKEVFVSKPLS